MLYNFLHLKLSATPPLCGAGESVFQQTLKREKSKKNMETRSIKNKTKVLVIAGGTGGHIVPGIALALELNTQGAEVHLLSLSKNQGYNDFASLAIPLHFYDAVPLPRKGISLQVLIFSWYFCRAFWQALRLLRKEGIENVVGMGGYATVPAILAAYILRLPYYLCEQNAVAGRASRLLAGGSRALFINFPFAHKMNANIMSKVYHYGNPLRPKLLQASKQRPIAENRVKKEKLCILVLGGSQGALQINTIAVELVYQFGSEFNWTIQCGMEHLEDLKKKLPTRRFSNVEMIGYTSDMAELYVKADLLLCRAGAGVLCEALSFGLPSLLIPYPYAADAHQEANADYLAMSNAALVFKQKGTNTSAIAKCIQWLKENPEELKEMSKAALSLALPEAGAKISSHILSKVHNNPK